MISAAISFAGVGFVLAALLITTLICFFEKDND